VAPFVLARLDAKKAREPTGVAPQFAQHLHSDSAGKYNDGNRFASGKRQSQLQRESVKKGTAWMRGRVWVS
jgi:hypothetical protein